MQFSQDGGVYKAVRITGPSHNLLGIAFADSEGRKEVVVVEAPGASGGEQSLLHGDEVRQYVCAGVQEANEELGTSYQPTRIQFVPSDTPPAETYKLLAKSIVERVARGGPFSEGTSVAS